MYSQSNNADDVDAAFKDIVTDGGFGSNSNSKNNTNDDFGNQFRPPSTSLPMPLGGGNDDERPPPPDEAEIDRMFDSEQWNDTTNRFNDADLPDDVRPIVGLSLFSLMTSSQSATWNGFQPGVMVCSMFWL